MKEEQQISETTGPRLYYSQRKLVRDATTDVRAALLRLEHNDPEPAAVLLRMALDQLEESGVLRNV